MSSSAVPDLYQRYKIGTKHVIQWLVHTAGQSRSLSSLLPDLHLPASQKARGKKKTKVKPTAAPQTAVLSTRDISHLAQSISQQATPTVRAPEGFETVISVLESVIAGRRECTTWYHQFIGAEEPDAKNDSHVHFVDVLRGILNELKHAYSKSKPPPTPRDAARTQPPTADVNLSNLFANLSIEHTSESFQTPAFATSQPTAKSATPPIVFELEKTAEDDGVFALWCFLKECHNVRRFVKQTWTEYWSGDLTLYVASRVTENASVLMHQGAEDLIAEFPKFEYFGHIAELFGIQLSTTAGKIDQFDCSRTFRAGQQDVEAVDLFCAPAWALTSLFRAFLTHLVDVQVGKTPPSDDLKDHFTKGHPIAENIVLTIRDLIYLSQLGDRCERLADVAGADLFTYGTIEQIGKHEKGVTLRYVMQFQMHMEIFEIVSSPCIAEWATAWTGYAERAQRLWRGFKDSVEKNNNGYELPAHFRDTPVRRWIERYITKGFETRIDGETAMGEDSDDEGSSGPGGVVGMQYKDGKVDRHTPSNPSPLLLRFPAMSGNLGATIAEFRHREGMEISNYGHVLVAMAHLYKACRKVGALKLPWKDMDFVISQHGPKAFGLRDTVDDAKPMLHAAKQYGMALGVELREYVKLRTRRGVGMSQRVPLPNYDAICKRGVELKVTSAYVTTLTECLRNKANAGLSFYEASRIALHHFAQKMLSDPRDELDNEARKQWEACHQLTPLQILTLLKSHLINYEPDLQFNYHGFYRQCCSYLSKLECIPAVGDRIKQLRHEAGISEEVTLYGMVDEILWEAANAESAGKRVLGSGSLLECFATMIGGPIERGGGSINFDEAIKLCSGHLAKRYHPQSKKFEIESTYGQATEEMKMSLKGSTVEVSSRPVAVDGNGSQEGMVGTRDVLAGADEHGEEDAKSRLT